MKTAPSLYKAMPFSVAAIRSLGIATGNAPKANGAAEQAKHWVRFAIALSGVAITPAWQTMRSSAVAIASSSQTISADCQTRFIKNKEISYIRSFVPS